MNEKLSKFFIWARSIDHQSPLDRVSRVQTFGHEGFGHVGVVFELGEDFYGFVDLFQSFLLSIAAAQLVVSPAS